MYRTQQCGKRTAILLQAFAFPTAPLPLLLLWGAWHWSSRHQGSNTADATPITLSWRVATVAPTLVILHGPPVTAAQSLPSARFVVSTSLPGSKVVLNGSVVDGTGVALWLPPCVHCYSTSHSVRVFVLPDSCGLLLRFA